MQLEKISRVILSHPVLLAFLFPCLHLKEDIQNTFIYLISQKITLVSDKYACTSQVIFIVFIHIRNLTLVHCYILATLICKSFNFF